jgi:alpha-1,6-mannosyltransferase
MQIRALATPSNIALVVIGGASVFLYIHALDMEGRGAGEMPWFIKLALTQGVLYFAAALIAWKTTESHSTLFIAIAFAVLFRFCILFTPPLLSDDAYRYVWDGRVQAAGINPYRYIPADQNLEKLRDTEIYPKINRKEYAPTIYPPAAEAIFLLTTRISESVIWMKATMVAFEALAVWALISLLASFRLPRHRVLIYAWHPLAVWEFAGSGHLDAIAIAFVALALLGRRRDLKAVTGLLLAGATLVKLYPAVLFPALYRRWDWKLPAVFAAATVLAYTPYLGVGIHGALGYLPGYMQEEGLTSGNRFFLLAAARRVLQWDSLPETVFICLAAAVLLALGLWCLRGRESGGPAVITRAFVLATVFTALLSPRYAWYFTWLIPFLCFVPALSVYYLTAASFILYLLWLDSARIFSLNFALYAPFAVLAGVQSWVAKARVGRPQKNPG